MQATNGWSQWTMLLTMPLNSPAVNPSHITQAMPHTNLTLAFHKKTNKKEDYLKYNSYLCHVINDLDYLQRCL